MCMWTIWSKYVNVMLKITLMEYKYSIYVVYPVINTISRKKIHISSLYIQYILHIFRLTFLEFIPLLTNVWFTVKKINNVRANDCKWMNLH